MHLCQVPPPAAPELVEPGYGVVGTITGRGNLDLRSVLTGAHHLGPGREAAMWIALRQGDGEVPAAARSLAAAWHVDLAAVRTELVTWLDDMAALGLVRVVAREVSGRSAAPQAADPPGARSGS